MDFAGVCEIFALNTQRASGRSGSGKGQSKHLPMVALCPGWHFTSDSCSDSTI